MAEVKFTSDFFPAFECFSNANNISAGKKIDFKLIKH